MPLPDAPGCPLFPETNVWNKPVGQLPLRSNSRKIVRAIGARLPVHADFGSGLWDGGPIGIPITVVNSTQASPGSRKFVISDQSSFHNFHLFGPGVSKKTGIDFVGSRTWKVTLQVGTYKFRCDAHPKMMRGSFTVS